MAKYGTRPPLSVEEERDELLAERTELRSEMEVLNTEISALQARLAAVLAAAANLHGALIELVEVKTHSDTVGKDEEYKRRQPLAWARARAVTAPGTGLLGLTLDEHQKILSAVTTQAEAIAIGHGLGREVERLRGLLNTPEIQDFSKAVVLEALHQRERWGSGKTDADWFWLLGFLAGKALHNPGDDPKKKLHRIITIAAAAANWHAAVQGQTNMRPGILPPPGVEKEPES